MLIKIILGMISLTWVYLADKQVTYFAYLPEKSKQCFECSRGFEWISHLNIYDKVALFTFDIPGLISYAIETWIRSIIGYDLGWGIVMATYGMVIILTLVSVAVFGFLYQAYLLIRKSFKT